MISYPVKIIQVVFMAKVLYAFLVFFFSAQISFSINIGNPVSVLGSTPAVRINQQNGEIVTASLMGGASLL